MASKVNIENAYEAAKKNGAVDSADNKFHAPIRNMDANDPLEVGDVIVIPKDYKVLKTTVGDSQDLYGFIIARVYNKEKNTEKVTRFFPNQLAKVVFPTENGKRLPKVKTTGTATDFYVKFGNIDDAMQAMVENGDREILITHANEYTYHDRFANRDRQTFVYQYDFVA